MSPKLLKKLECDVSNILKIQLFQMGKKDSVKKLPQLL